MIDECSKLAYQEIKRNGSIGERQLIVLGLFIDAYPHQLTAAQVVNKIGRGLSENTRNRITELVERGFLAKAGRETCSITGRKVNSYCWTGRKNPLPKILKKIKCPKCLGCGEIEKEVYYEPSDNGQMKLFR